MLGFGPISGGPLSTLSSETGESQSVAPAGGGIPTESRKPASRKRVFVECNGQVLAFATQTEAVKFLRKQKAIAKGVAKPGPTPDSAVPVARVIAAAPTPAARMDAERLRKARDYDQLMQRYARWRDEEETLLLLLMD